MKFAFTVLTVASVQADSQGALHLLQTRANESVNKLDVEQNPANDYELKSANKRCSNWKKNGEWTRVWTSGITLKQCSEACKAAGNCNIFSWGQEGGKDVCLYNAPKGDCREENLHASWGNVVYNTYRHKKCWVKLCQNCNPVAGAGSGGQGILDEINAWTDSEGVEHKGTQWFEDRKEGQAAKSNSAEECFQRQAAYDRYCRVPNGVTKLRWQANKPTDVPSGTSPVDGCTVSVDGIAGVSNVPSYTLSTMNFKCQEGNGNDGGERIWRKDGLADISECAVWCLNTADCNFFTFGFHTGENMNWCMACTDIQNKDPNGQGWGLYEMQATRKKAQEYCESHGETLCTSVQVLAGDPDGCTVAWMADNKGYWRSTDGGPGCASTGSRTTLVSYGDDGEAYHAYCCATGGACSGTSLSNTQFFKFTP